MIEWLASRHLRRNGGPGISSMAKGVVIGAVVSTVALGSATAFAGTGIGAVFNLGKTNTVNASSTLTATTSGRSLNVVNKGTGPGLGVTVGAGKAPLVVNPEAGKAVNLDADKLDGQDASAFLGAGAKANDADLLDGMDSSDFAAAGHNHDGAYVATSDHTKAAHDALGIDAATVDGKDSSDFLASGAQAADSDRLDGLDSASFVRGPGQIYRGAIAIPRVNGGWRTVLTTANPSLTVGYLCRADLTTNGIVVLRNDGAETVNVFADNGGADPMYRQLGPNGGRWDSWGAASGEHLTVQVQGAQMATLEIFSVHRPDMDNCHVQATAVVSR